MKKFITTFSVLLLYVICALGQEGTITVDFNQKSNGVINVPQDKILAINLPAKPSNGFTWDVVDMDGNILEKDPQLHYTSFNKGVGSDGYRQIRFLAKKEGLSTLKLVYHRPWEKTKASKEATYTVKTEGAYTGSIRFNQDQYKAPVLNKGDYEVKALPSYYSLVDDGEMSSVKNQGSCGSCWAFAAVGVFENVIIMEDNAERNLSEQWMVNCGGNYGHNGCSGGWCPFEMFYEGAVYENDEPYTASDGYCQSSYPRHEEISGWSYIAGSQSTPSTTAMKQAIYDYGAIWVAVASSGMSSYTGGVWYGNGSTSIDHAVVLCGWDDNNQCWIMRNSWGPNWGESGYMRIRYGANAIGYAAAYLTYEGSGEDDTQAPTAPSNLTSSNITSSSVRLSWNASSDNVGVTGYNIYKDGSLYTNVTGTSANITGLSANTRYSFYVKAYDAAGNISSASNTISITTDEGGDDTEAPTAPSNLGSSNITTSSVSLSWNASSDNVGVTGYNIYKDGSYETNVSGTSATINGLSANTTYSFYVKAYDAAGNVSNASNTISVTTDDDNPSEYCASKGNNTSYFWINYVGLNNMVNMSGNDGGYGNYTNKTAGLMPGYSYTLFLQSAYYYYIYTVYWSIWIDYNQNGTFESTERVLSGPTATSNFVSGTFTVPYSVATGTTRMRISMKYGSQAGPCETFNYGEVEDYTINIGYGAQDNSVAVNNINAEPLGYVKDFCRVYPSPASDIIHVNVNAIPQSDINIISVDGKIIKTIKATGNELEIDISDLNPSVYLLQYRNELGETKAERFVKEQ